MMQGMGRNPTTKEENMSSETTYRVWDTSGTDVEIEAETPEDAAQKYVADGDWGPQTKTQFHNIQVIEVDGDDLDAEDHLVSVDPDEPPCDDDGEHDWRSPYALLGGLKENPGVFGHGGGVVSTEICVRCGCARTTDTWAQCPSTGQQGLESIEYDLDDERLEIYLNNFDSGDLLDDFEIAKGDGWDVFIGRDEVTGRWAAVSDEEHNTDVTWFLTRDEALNEAKDWAEGLAA